MSDREPGCFVLPASSARARALDACYRVYVRPRVGRALLAAFAMFLAAAMALGSMPTGSARLAARIGQAARIAALGARAPRAALRPTHEGTTHDLASKDDAPTGLDHVDGALAPIDPSVVARQLPATRADVPGSSPERSPASTPRVPVARGPPRTA